MFNHSNWLKPYIELNTKLQTAAAQSDFEKDFFKLMNNSFFEKAMKNIRNHVDVRLVTEWKQEEKLAAKVNYRPPPILMRHL